MKETISKNLKPIIVVMGLIVLILVVKKAINEKS
jgi:hypothetical protein